LHQATCMCYVHVFVKSAYMIVHVHEYVYKYICIGTFCW